MKSLFALSLTMLFFLLGSISVNAQVKCNPNDCPPECKKLCELVCAKASTSTTTAQAVQLKQPAESGATATATCIPSACKKMAATGQTETEKNNSLQPAVLVGYKENPTKATAAKCSKETKPEGACVKRKE